MKKPLLLALALVAMPALADYSADRMLSDMRKQSGPSIQATFYLAGAVDAMNVEQVLNRRDDFCVPADVTLGQIYDVTRIYAAANPVGRQVSATLYIRLALSQTWPCPK